MKAFGSSLLCFILLGLMAPVFSSAMSADAIQPATRRKIAPELLEALAAQREAQVPVIVMMQDQVDLERLNAEMAAERIDRGSRARRVISLLKEVASRTQAPLLAEDARWRATGALPTFRPLWMVNALLVSGTPEVVVEIAERTDVASLFLDSVIEGDQVFGATPPVGDRNRNQVRAPRDRDGSGRSG